MAAEPTLQKDNKMAVGRSLQKGITIAEVQVGG